MYLFTLGVRIYAVYYTLLLSMHLAMYSIVNIAVWALAKDAWNKEDCPNF